jgi:hypothetical protein
MYPLYLFLWLKLRARNSCYTWALHCWWVVIFTFFFIFIFFPFLSIFSSMYTLYLAQLFPIYDRNRLIYFCCCGQFTKEVSWNWNMGSSTLKSQWLAYFAVSATIMSSASWVGFYVQKITASLDEYSVLLWYWIIQVKYQLLIFYYQKLWDNIHNQALMPSWQVTHAQTKKPTMNQVIQITYSIVVAPKLLRNGSLNALPGNRYVLDNRRIVGSGVFFAVCSEAT